MTARLIAVTQPVVDFIPDAEGLIVYCARVSNPANQRNFSTADRLLSYCRRNEHWSVFEMASAVVEIETTRDIARQILRHRSFSFQEFSQRYASAFGTVRRDLRRQDAKNRQSSHDDLPWWKRVVWAAMQEVVIWTSASAYAATLRMGGAKECARSLLPEGTTMSRIYMHGTLRSWMHWLKVREAEGTQLEHRQVAAAVRAVLEPHFPAVLS